jgi:hypothetical protein
MLVILKMTTVIASMIMMMMMMMVPLPVGQAAVVLDLAPEVGGGRKPAAKANKGTDSPGSDSGKKPRTCEYL